jgi:plasmid segregation protein ParM
MNIGLDVGYSATKAISGGRRVTFPSVVGTPDKARFSINGASAQDIILTEPAHVAVGDAAVIQSRHLMRREDRGWIESDEWYNLALAAFTELTTGTVAELTVVTGLPVAFYSDKETVRARLVGEHRVARDGRDRAQMFKVTEARVIPQPFGALLAMSLDNAGRIVNRDLAHGNVGVIDVGGKTTNLLSVYKLSEVGRETSSVSVGAWDAARAVQRWLSDNYPDLELRAHQVMDAIKTRQVKYFGETVDLAAVIDAALAPMSEQVIAEATQLWNGAGTLDTILVTGGGALLLGPAIKAHFRHAVVVDDPVYANALGFYRLAQNVASKS